jgi:Zn-dependent peptidase ImmA (M78 family)/DNA-binding XRE family transcriptional regulator
MRPGTPQFIGERLREAREVRGHTQITLSEVLGVSNSAISQYEKGVTSPYPEIMDKLLTALNFPANFFFTPPRPPEEETIVFYRSRKSATIAARKRAEWKYTWLKEVVDYLSQFFEFPNVNFPNCPFTEDPFDISMKHIEIAASSLRTFWGLGDKIISNTVYLLENNGAIVTKLPFDNEALDAFSNWRWIENRPYVILGSDKLSASRSRLDVCHELGHMVLHRNVKKEDFKKKSVFDLIEDQAYAFAGAFLMPASSFASEFIPNLIALQSLKMRWNVSIAAMIMRGRNLGLLSEDQERNLWRNYARKGYRRHEPLDDQIEHESPAVLRQSFETLIEHKIQTKDQILSSFCLGQKDIEELAVLPEGFLTDKPKAKVIDFNKRRESFSMS